jgi:DNA modification methylase
MKSQPTVQLTFPFDVTENQGLNMRRNTPWTNGRANYLDSRDKAFHDWYRFVLSYPPHLVRHYLNEFGLVGKNFTLLDPFCGTGTSLVEAKLNSIQSVGIEAHPFSAFASCVKVDWEIDPESLYHAAHAISEEVRNIFREQNLNDDNLTNPDELSISLRTLSPDLMKLLITDSISPLPLHKVLVLLASIRKHQEDRYYNHYLLALANSLVFKISNLRFGPEVGVGQKKIDVPVVSSWLSEIDKMVDDLHNLPEGSYSCANIYQADARDIAKVVPPLSIDAVITSPPYPNEKDYTRTTRLESVILGFITDKGDLRRLKQNLVRSNTRGVYKDDADDEMVNKYPEIQAIADAIERRRIELGKTSGFERLYSRVTKLYFGGMARHLADLREILRPGAQLAYVVGDQASYLQVFIPTGKLLADIAIDLGYELIRIDLFRTRFATGTKQQLREEVVVLHWPKER